MADSERQAGRRVLMVALDSLEITMLERFFAAGELPNLAAFAGQSERARVRSDGARLHGSVWPTFASGGGPGKHGIYFWTQWKAEDMAYTRNSDPAFDFDGFWSVLGPAGRRATVIDVPYVRPTDMPGIRIAAGWGLHDEMVAVSSPDGYMESIERRYGKHPLQFDVVEPLSGRDKLKMARDLRRGVHARAKLVRDLAASRESDLVLVVFSELHKAMHYLAAPEELASGITNERAVRAILEPLDRAWPDILEAAGSECDVLLFALHGIHEQRPFDGLGRQVLDVFAGREPVDDATQEDLLRRLRNMLPRQVHEAVWRRLPPALRARRHGHLQTAQSELAGERVFRVAHDGHPAFRVNLRGRERDGSVAPGDDARVLRELETLATGLTTPDGVPAFTGMWRSSEAPGPRAHRLPDGILLTNPELKRVDELVGPEGLRLRTAATERRNGIHTSEGFLFARLSDMKVTRAEVNALDFAPTVLELLGVERPAFDGRSFVA